jgi:hypothetical protein
MWGGESILCVMLGTTGFKWTTSIRWVESNDLAWKPGVLGLVPHLPLCVVSWRFLLGSHFSHLLNEAFFKKKNMISLCSPRWPWNIPASASRVLGLTGKWRLFHSTMAGIVLASETTINTQEKTLLKHSMILSLMDLMIKTRARQTNP